MTTRIEILNAGTNRNRVRVQHVTVTRNPDGSMVCRPAEGGDELLAIPGQRATLRAGETFGRCILIEELPPEEREHLPPGST